MLSAILKYDVVEAHATVWYELVLRVKELSHSGKETMVRRFDHEGLRQLQNCFVKLLC